MRLRATTINTATSRCSFAACCRSSAGSRRFRPASRACKKRYFFTYTLAGSGIFCFGLAYLGSYFGNHLDAVAPHIHQISIGLLVVVVLAAVGFAIYHFNRRKAASAS